jgi:hypothetical protein
MRKDDLVLALLSQTGFVSNKKEITPWNACFIGVLPLTIAYRCGNIKRKKEKKWKRYM